MIERILQAKVEAWVYAAPDLGVFHERDAPQKREEHKSQLRGQSLSIGNYRTVYEFFYG